MNASAPYRQPVDIEKLLYKLVVQFVIYSQGSHPQLEPQLLQFSKRDRKSVV